MTTIALPGGTARIFITDPGFINIIVDDEALAHAANSFNDQLDLYEAQLKKVDSQSIGQ